MHPETLPLVLQAHNITLTYPAPGAKRVTVLHDFSLSLQAGETVAILGPSGVGKSSLLKVLAGLQQPDHGSANVHGTRIQGPHPRLGFVFQDPTLLPWLNLEQNVAFGLDFKHQPALSPQQQKHRIRDAIDEVGLSYARDRYPQELSGGMAQRAALARCLAREPEILLLDEPFSALDEVTRAEMQGLLKEVSTRHKAAALLVTHDIDEALLVADRIVLIGGQPGTLVGSWTLEHPYPRDTTDDALAALRLDILRSLKAVRTGKVAVSNTATN